jgi:hypothetical protein
MNAPDPNTLPAPLTAADSDLRDFIFMPLDVVRLRDSDIAAISSGDEFRCAVLLWCASWHQVPAASLPDDDLVLAQYAGFGRVVKEWKKVRDGALRGWVKCADGRLYHPVVAEKANEAWAGRVAHREKKEAERVRKAAERAAKKAQEEAAQRAAEEALNRGGNDQDNKDLSGGQTGNVQRTDPGNPAENALRGKERGTGTVERDSGQGQLTTNPDHHHHADSSAHDFEPPLYGAPLPPREEPPPPEGDNQPAIALTVDLRKWGVNATFTHPAVQDWANREISRDILAAAVAEAREVKGDASIAPNYLVPIVERLIAQQSMPKPEVKAQPEQQPADRWWTSNAGIERKGRELGMFARGSEDHAAFKDRIFKHLRDKGQQP